MSLRTSIIVKDGISAVTLTGGTDKTYINDGRGSNGVNVLVDSSNGDLTTRKSIQTRLTQPALAPNANAMAKLGRAEMTVKHPSIRDGKQYNEPSMVSFTFHPATTEAERGQRLDNLIAILSDPELRSFFTKAVND